MSSPELDNLARIGKLKREPPAHEEIAGLLASAGDAGLCPVLGIKEFVLEYLAG